MMNRHRLIALVLMAGMLWSGPALADFQTDIVRQLQGMGFARIDVSRTLLGRVRIVAAGSEGTREIILNPNTGEILRDLWLQTKGRSSEGGLLAPSARTSGRSSGGSGSDDGKDDDGDDEDDDKDDEDDDKSGSNSGSSGSGGSGSSGGSSGSSGSNSGSSGSGKGGSDSSGSDDGDDDGGDDDKD